MNSKQLHYFLTTLETGSIASAARQLDIAQPAISQQLANLEREMGAKFLVRSYKGVSLTEAGKVFANHAQKFVDEIAVLKTEIKQITSNCSDTLRLGLLPSIGNVLSMSLIEEAKRFFPKLTIEISTGPSYVVKEWLRNNQIDIAISYEQELDSRVSKSDRLIQECMYLVVGVNDDSNEYHSLKNRETIRFWELCEYELLMPSERDSLGKLIRRYEQNVGITLKHDSTYSGQLTTGLRQVIQGQGVMILPSSAMFHLENNKVVKTLRIVDPNICRIAMVATNANVPPLDITTKVINLVKDCVASQYQSGNWRGTLLF